MAAVRLRSAEFRREREKHWRALERLVATAEQSGLPSLSSMQLTQLPRLYRGALSALSVARAISLDRNLTAYLESLTARAYIVVYGTRGGVRAALGEFFRRTFPATVRRLAPAMLLAGLFLAAGAVTGFAMTRADPEHYYSFVSEDMAGGRTPAAGTEELREVLYSTGEEPGGGLAYFASFLFTHNAQIGMLAFALGFAAGLLVFLLLFTNGLSLGAMAALYHSRGLSVEFWGWILPHGVTEILALILCGGAGLALGRALVFPGELRRRASLARAGRGAGLVVMGTLAMFFIAGLVEGVFRQTVLSVSVRYLVAGATATFWALYLGFAGRRRGA